MSTVTITFDAFLNIDQEPVFVEAAPAKFEMQVAWGPRNRSGYREITESSPATLLSWGGSHRSFDRATAVLLAGEEAVQTQEAHASSYWLETASENDALDWGEGMLDLREA